MSTRGPRFARGVRELAEHYDAFLIDQYGVLHDGRRAYPGVDRAMSELVAAGKQVVLLTNSGRSAAYNAERVARRGVPLDGVRAVVTSGDVARAWLRRSWPDARAYVLASDGDTSDIERAGIVVVDRVRDADLLLVCGLPKPAGLLTEDSVAPLLAAGAERRLPMVCCNPDRQTLVGERVVPATGAIAAWYAALGGEVRYVGKPHREVFDAALASLDAVDRARVLMLGDMPATDLRGAATIGIDAAFVLDGVHRDATSGATPAQRTRRACALLAESGTRAAWLIESLRW